MKDTKMSYVRVYNKILDINSDIVTFENSSVSITWLKRIYQGKIVIWKLLRDGIYVEKGYAVSYGLSLTPK